MILSPSNDEKFLVALLSAFGAPGVYAQEIAPLAVTLPGGKVIYSETEDRKVKLFAARGAAAAGKIAHLTVTNSNAGLS